MNKKTKFAVIADLHVDIMHDAEERLKAFLDAARAADVDFVIQLGDFCYPDEGRRCVCAPEKRPQNIEVALKFPTYADKETIHNLYRNFEKPSYHVIGNHDCDMCTKRQVLDYYRADYEPYYSFDCGGFHFIVLDPNYYKKDGKYVSYECGNYFDESYHAARVLPYLPPEQLEWLKNDLDCTELPSVIFSHQCLKEGECGAILNAREFKEAIEGRRSRVVASFSGHSHLDYAVRDNRVWYMHINSASNFWIGSKYTCLGRYGSEIDEKYPNIRYVAPYSNPIYAIIELNERGAYIKGTDGEFVGKSPDELGWYKDKGYDKASHPETEIKPYIEDRFLPFD